LTTHLSTAKPRPVSVLYAVRRLVFAALFGAMLWMLAAVPAFAAATPWVGDANASARLITAVQATGSAGQIDAGLQIRLAPSRYMLYGLITQGYEQGVVLPLAVTLDHADQPVFLHALVHYSACKTICVPYTALLTLKLPAGIAAPGPQAPLISQAWKTVPADLAQAGLTVSHVAVSKAHGKVPGAILSFAVDGSAPLRRLDVFIDNLPDATASAPRIWRDPARNRAVLSVFVKAKMPEALADKPLRFTLENGEQAAVFNASPAFGPPPREDTGPGDLRIFLIALLGGLILNVMPCVLPVLSLKLMGFAAVNSTERRQFRFNLLASASGVIVSFLLIALALILLKAAGAAIGWGIQFQQPWFLASMAVLTTLFAASLWEWLPIPMPGFAAPAATIGTNAHPRIAAFATGAFATVLATSCSAPFVGTAVGFALARDPATIAGIFAALGIGMALPYLAVAALPGLVRWMPKPGGWMVWVRIILGFALFGTALWLVSIIANVVSPHAAAITGGLLAILLAVLFVRHWLRNGRGLMRGAGAVAAALVIAAIIIPITLPPAASRPVFAAGAGVPPWQPFQQARITRLLARHELVFVDVTAAWCLICKVNALRVLDRDPVLAQLRAGNVVAMRADWTRPSPIITAFLESFHRYGVPLDVMYGPGAPSGILLPSLLNSGMVMQAFRRAGTAHQTEALR
jgi:suppressor for copper-sensitivity B